MAQILPFNRESASFEPEALATAIRAYDKAIVELGLGHAPAVVREVIASRIIQLMTEGERDPDALCGRAVATTRVPT